MKYPIGIQDFESLRNDGYVYVDKTAQIHGLVNYGLQNILVRPPRFGKSLLLSTIKAYCEGKCELFNGLAIEGLETEWIKHPVLLLDLSHGTYDTEEALNDVLDSTLTKWEAEYGLETKKYSLPSRFECVIRTACEKTGQDVVVLVDEYDKPCRDACADEELCEKFRRTLMSFFTSVLNAFSKCRFESYWFKAGAQSFLPCLLRDTHYGLSKVEEAWASSDELEVVASFKTCSLAAILCQCGYLTIKDYKECLRHYVLGFPNREVEEGFTNATAKLGC